MKIQHPKSFKKPAQNTEAPALILDQVFYVNYLHGVDMIKAQRRIFKVSEIVPADYNPRKINKKSMKGLTKSLDKFGYLQDIIVNIRDQKNKIVGGHQRLTALGLPPDEEIECTIVDLSDIQEKALNIALNNKHISGEYTEELKDILSDLSANFEDFEELNFDDLAVEFDFNFEEEPPGDGDNVPEVVEDPVIKLGDLIELGGHRLLCGDSTDKEQVEKLMGGEKADMVFTDPPYGISLIKNKTGKVGGGTKQYPTKEFSKIIDDDKPFDPTFIKNYSDKLIIWGGNYYIDKLENSRCWFIWNKNHPVDRTFCGCELAWTNLDRHSKIYSSTWDGYTKEGESGSKVHPSQKPIKLCADILIDTTEENECILDLFLGSGTTLIACEKTNRKCYGMELDEKYCQVIIQRWCDYTEKTEIKINGETVNWTEYKK